MTKFAKFMLAGALAVPAALSIAPAQAQVGGIAVADMQGAIANTKAWQAARTQIQATYKPQLDRAEARSRAIQAELQPLVTQFNTARAAPNANQAALQTQAQAIQAKQTAAQQELGRITAPAERAQQYAIEQIQGKLQEAVQSVVRAKNVSLLVAPQAVLFAQPVADVTPAVTTELDRLIPTVNTTPPAGWQPGQQQAAAGTAPATTTPVTTPRRNTGGR